MSARELLHWSPYLNLCPEGLVLMLKKQDLGINPYVSNNGSRDQSLTGIGGPRVYVVYAMLCFSVATTLQNDKNLKYYFRRYQIHHELPVQPESAGGSAVPVSKLESFSISSRHPANPPAFAECLPATHVTVANLPSITKLAREPFSGLFPPSSEH